MSYKTESGCQHRNMRAAVTNDEIRCAGEAESLSVPLQEQDGSFSRLFTPRPARLDHRSVGQAKVARLDSVSQKSVTRHQTHLDKRPMNQDDDGAVDETGVHKSNSIKPFPELTVMTGHEEAVLAPRRCSSQVQFEKEEIVSSVPSWH